MKYCMKHKVYEWDKTWKLIITTLSYTYEQYHTRSDMLIVIESATHTHTVFEKTNVQNKTSHKHTHTNLGKTKVVNQICWMIHLPLTYFDKFVQLNNQKLWLQAHTISCMQWLKFFVWFTSLHMRFMKFYFDVDFCSSLSIREFSLCPRFRRKISTEKKSFTVYNQRFFCA